MRKLYQIAKNFGYQVSRKNISAYAASTAFFLFLSLIPLLMLVCAILPYTPITEGMLMKTAIEVLPHSADSLVVYLIGEVYDKSAGAVSLAALVTIWISAKGMLALMRGLNAVNGVERKRNYFLLRFEACLYTILMLAAMFLSLIILVFGNKLAELFFHSFPELHFLTSFFLHVRFFLVLVILTLEFAVIYTYVPQTYIKFKRQIPGAFFAAVTWSVFSWGFSVYIDRFDGMSMYGNLTTVIIIMFWMYFCIYILLIGATLNEYIKPAIRVLEQKNR